MSCGGERETELKSLIIEQQGQGRDGKEGYEIMKSDKYLSVQNTIISRDLLEKYMLYPFFIFFKLLHAYVYFLFNL